MTRAALVIGLPGEGARHGTAPVPLFILDLAMAGKGNTARASLIGQQ
jgi:hypothetical protein